MKTTKVILWALCVFYVIVGVGYIVWTIMDGELEWVGTVTLLLMATFTAFVAFYLGVEEKPFLKNALPEDRLDAEIADADEELGFFSPWSWWPFMLAMSIGAVLVGVSVGWWIAFFAAPFVAIGIIGWFFEYYRGRFRH